MVPLGDHCCTDAPSAREAQETSRALPLAAQVSAYTPSSTVRPQGSTRAGAGRNSKRWAAVPLDGHTSSSAPS